MRRIDVVLVLWLCLSLLFWGVYALAGHYTPFALYYTLFLGIFGSLVWVFRIQLEERFRHWERSDFSKFLILGYGMILVEEVFAALTNNISEGFSVPLFLARIPQFWAFNIFAFTGFIVGWYLLTRWFQYSNREVFYLAGIWGLYAEKTIFALAVNPAAFLLLAVPNIFTYGLIISPALLSRSRTGRHRLHAALKYPLTYVVIFLCSLIPMGILIALRAHFPNLFPPTNLVS